MIATSGFDNVIYAADIDLSDDWSGDWVPLQRFNECAFSLSWLSGDLDLAGTFYVDLAIAYINSLGGGQLIVPWYHTVTSLVIAAGVQPDTTSLWLTDPIVSCVTSARIRWVSDSGSGTLNALNYAKTNG